MMAMFRVVHQTTVIIVGGLYFKVAQSRFDSFLYQQRFSNVKLMEKLASNLETQ